MNITAAKVVVVQGYPVLEMTIDGHFAYTIQPKHTLVKAGIVVLLDHDRYWETATNAIYDPGDGSPAVRVPGGTRDPKVIAIVKKFTKGAEGDLLAKSRP